jgi:hypothetical protein
MNGIAYLLRVSGRGHHVLRGARWRRWTIRTSYRCAVGVSEATGAAPLVDEAHVVTARPGLLRVGTQVAFRLQREPSRNAGQYHQGNGDRQSAHVRSSSCGCAPIFSRPPVRRTDGHPTFAEFSAAQTNELHKEGIRHIIAS